MKVYVITKAHLFEEEVYVGVANSLKNAEKKLRKEYPHMKPTGSTAGVSTYVSEKLVPELLFIHEEELA